MVKPLSYYFQQEMIALRKDAAEAVRKNPALAPILGTPGSDPDVERLFEAFSFLAGRLRQTLDDELPDITEGLFSRVWPEYLRPIPSFGILEYRPTESIAGTTSIPRGTRVSSAPVNGTPCHFKTVYDTNFYPLKLSKLFFKEVKGNSALVLGFTVTNGTFDLLSLPTLRVHFHGDRDIAATLFNLFFHETTAVKIFVPDGDTGHYLGELRRDELEQIGFCDEQWLLPYGPHTKRGYKVIQEYFLFPEKFLFADILNLTEHLKRGALPVERGGLPDNVSRTYFELHFDLNAIPENHEKIQTDNVRLFCTPIVNLFEMSSVQMSIPAQGRRKYPVIPDHTHRDNITVYSIDRVAGWSQAAKAEVSYVNAISGCPGVFAKDPTYTVRVAPVLTDTDFQTLLSVNADGFDSSISLDLTCTNGMLPRELRAGSIHNKEGGGESIPYVNIGRVSEAFPPPTHNLWGILSGMSLNNIVLSSVDPFKAFLSTYCFSAKHNEHHKKQLELFCDAIVSVKSKREDRLHRGWVMPGMTTSITLDDTKLSCPSEAYLFGSVLSQFLSLYATPYSFHRTIVRTVSGQEYAWPMKTFEDTL